MIRAAEREGEVSINCISAWRAPVDLWPRTPRGRLDIAREESDVVSFLNGKEDDR
jgi:hypothetical protein